MDAVAVLGGAVPAARARNTASCAPAKIPTGVELSLPEMDREERALAAPSRCARVPVLSAPAVLADAVLSQGRTRQMRTTAPASVPPATARNCPSGLNFMHHAGSKDGRTGTSGMGASKAARCAADGGSPAASAAAKLGIALAMVRDPKLPASASRCNWLALLLPATLPAGCSVEWDPMLAVSLWRRPSSCSATAAACAWVRACNANNDMAEAAAARAANACSLARTWRTKECDVCSNRWQMASRDNSTQSRR